MTPKDPIVWVVDDNPDALAALSLQLRTAGFTVVPCVSGAEFLAQVDPEIAGCVLLDLRMPGMGGLALQEELTRRGDTHPIVFLSGHGEIEMAVRAVKEGALDFLEKPVREAQLVAVLQRALAVDRERRAAAAQRGQTADLLANLSPREAQVADLILEGLRTAEIAERLQLSPRTIEMHRARLVRRLGARTIAEAARIIQQAKDLDG